MTDTEKKIAELQQEIERLKEERDAAVEGYQQQVKYAGELMTKLVSAQQELKKVNRGNKWPTADERAAGKGRMSEMIKIKVQNNGLYSKNMEGTWNELVEEMATRVDGWNTYYVDRVENRRQYWGTLNNEEGKPIYTFWAIVTAEWGEIEIEPLNE